MNIKKYMEDNYLIFDGAMGSLLQQNGLKAGEVPEFLNITNPSLIEEIHYNYLKAGSNIVLTNTFQANPFKIKDDKYSLSEVIKSAINNARNAVDKIDKQAYVAYDIGPLGQLLKPSGTLSFEDAYDAFKEIVVEANKYNIDVFVVETCSDLLEMKAAILAIKEHSDKPVFSTMTFQENQRTLVGNDIYSVITTLEGLKVDALGLNCSFGPKEMLPLIEEFNKYASIPIIVQPNAGMPILNGDEIKYDIDENDFLEYMKPILENNVQIVGGCCGTEYAHIELLANYVSTLKHKNPVNKNLTMVASGMKTVVLDDSKIIRIGERINPTGKKDLEQALRDNNYNYLIKEAIKQEEGADVLDINVGITNIDESVILKNSVEQIQSYVKTPLQIDSSNAKSIEAALRTYNGKAIINSVNGKEESMNEILPLVAKYGGVIIGLCLDKNGLAFSAKDKLEVARKIVNRAKEYGIESKDILIDTLTLTASAQQADVLATIQAISLIKKELGVKTVLGASNVSYGLPNRDLINASFLSMAAYAGLDACIINTGSTSTMNTLMACEVLLNKDKNSNNYIASFQDYSVNVSDDKSTHDLKTIIIKGLKDEAIKACKKELETRDVLDIIENDIVKALDYVGNKFEKKELFLPQLIQSAQTVSEAFEVIKKQMSGSQNQKNEKIILATVKGDVHDIGKNIVKMLLENYGYEIIDLGKDVDSKTIIDCIKENDVKLVGLSALMTTTVINMEETIRLIKEYDNQIKIMVGGAVLTEEYAKKINADYYCKDALSGVDAAKSFFK
ncbi:5-methyltetrahydrofolate--homocysteine methyltransferase [Bacilli bacterium PM5-9]|nr:5-methyltetrahydrofolate--homocysteine methyltransferase [Bacilli bacterium PM5-9]